MHKKAGYIHALATTLLLAISARSALATETSFDVGTTFIKFTPADGFCVLDPTFPFDKVWLEFQEKTHANVNELVGAAAPCSELAVLRQGTEITLTRWVVLLSPTQGKVSSSPIPGITRKQLVGLLTKEFKKGVDIDVDAISKKTSDTLKETTGEDQPITISGFNALEFLHKSDDAVFAGLKLHVATNGTGSNIGVVFGMTLVKQHIVSINSYRTYESPNTINLLLDETKMLMKTMLASN